MNKPPTIVMVVNAGSYTFYSDGEPIEDVVVIDHEWPEGPVVNRPIIQKIDYMNEEDFQLAFAEEDEEPCVEGCLICQAGMH